MFRIMADNDVLGYVGGLMGICQSPAWIEFWRGLECVVWTFADVGLAANAPDSAVWEACQANEIILITGNRNAEGSDSLEATIRQRNNASSLPVLTLSDPRRIARDRQYAEMAVERLFEILIDIDMNRGTGRLFLP